jgi:xanthosine utilization system XapX-like protein
MTKTIGVVLIVLGLIGIAWGSFTYTTKEKVVDRGPIEATRDKQHTVPVSPIAGAVALLGRIALVVTGKR